MRNGILTCLVIGLTSIAGYGQEAAPPRPYPAPCADAAAGGSSGDKLDHLLKAAAHLEAAGMKEQAQSLRKQANQEKQALVAKLKALESEVERLRRLTGSVPQVLVHVKMMELSRSKLRKLGFDFGVAGASGSQVLDLGKPGSAERKSLKFALVDDDQALLATLEALREDKLLRVLAERTLVTVSGRPAFCHVGGEVPVLNFQGQGALAVEYKGYGARVDLLPLVLPSGRIRMEARVRVSELDRANGVEVDGQTVHAFKTHEVDTGVEMEADQTLIIAGLVQRRIDAAREEAAPPDDGQKPQDVAGRTQEADEEIERLILVTPEIVQRGDPPLPAAAKTPAGSPHQEEKVYRFGGIPFLR